MMSRSASWSNRRKAFFAVTLALILWAPQGISTSTQPVVTGHSTFYNGDVFDQCLASIAGILRSRIMWFNDQVLVEHYPGKGTFIYVTEVGAPSPLARSALYTEGVFYSFTDPNGVHWHIEEAFYDWNYAAYDNSSAFIQDPLSDQDPAGAHVDAGIRDGGRTYVWIVELSDKPIHDQWAPTDPMDPNYHTVYNFVALIDTCKFNDQNTVGALANHTGTEDGHPAATGAHEHEQHLANLYIGKRPNLIPFIGEHATPNWQSQWASP